MHEIHTYYITFYWKFSQVSRGIKRNILSFILFGSERNYYDMVANILVSLNLHQNIGHFILF